MTPTLLADWEVLRGARVLAAVSGGADSTALLHMLHRASGRRGFELACAHVNHGLRGAESDADEVFVRGECERLGVPLHAARLDPKVLDTVNEGSLREARLGALKALARSTGAGVLAFGHHGDDLAESFLLMALRGSGPGGLGSMRPMLEVEDGLMLWRPLLDCRRATPREWLSACGIGWREDSSNASPRFRRNRLRAEVLPLLEEIAPGASECLARSARWCAAESGALEEAAGAAFRRCCSHESQGVVVLDAAQLRAEAPPVGLEALRVAWRRVSGTVPSWSVQLCLEDRVESGRGDERTFGPDCGVAAHVCARAVTIHRAEDSVADALARAPWPWIVRPDGAALDQHLNSAEFVNAPGLVEALLAGRAAESAAAFDADALSAPLELRPAPLDAALDAGPHLRSVRKCLKDAKVPGPLRDRLAGVWCGDALLWLPGIRRAAGARVTERTRRLLLLLPRR
ncbi:MAG: tRNA lysidine(34) synthetase TilS [Candidatus Sumerlaeia bacterium]|nr:tRNA lysidine(34) synthetase TilS [Candidatus Sumerlaeia bacterium]